jgi:hypothetical protein
MSAKVPTPDGDAREPALEIEPIGVRVHFEQLASGSQWESRSWRLAAVEPGQPDESLQIRLHRDEAQGYFLNVTADEPSIFVLWRLESGAPEAVVVTVSYDEAARSMDGGESVDRVPMPPEMVEWLAEYVRLHYRPETKRKRRGAKPSFMAREEFAGMAAREADGGASAQAGAQAQRAKDRQ